jgi:DNA-binding protein YbaB
MKMQGDNYERKVKLLTNIIEEDPETLSKINISKVNTALKKIN